MKPGDSFAIIGLGLMGGSYAMGLTRAGYRVAAVDTDADTIFWAAQQGLIAQGTAGDAAPVLAGADYVVLALYPKDILPWLRENAAFLKPGAMLTDVSGVKGLFVHEAQALLAGRHEFIPSHPMAGREVSGVKNANTEMFRSANFIITPTERNTPAGVAFARTLAETLGFARITQLTVEEHDRMIGYVSQLTHAIAVSLMNANDDPRLPEVTGDSFRDLTRIADINAELWSELFLANRGPLVAEIDAFTACLTQLRGAVQSGDEAALQAMLRQSAARRREFGRKA